MKRVFFVLITLFSLHLNVNSQWYTRRYGVNDINKLTTEQLNEALKRAKYGATTGYIISGIGLAGICTGVYFIAHSKKVYPEANDLTNLQLTGFTMILFSIPVEITGLIRLGINNYRKRGIMELIRKQDLKIGLLNYPVGKMYSVSQSPVLPGFSLKIDF